MSHHTAYRRWNWRAVALGAVMTVVTALAACSHSSPGTVRISQQYGIGYLPLMVMQQQQLVEKQAAKRGIKNLKVEWKTLGGGDSASAALLSGSLDFAASGVGPLLKIWDKTKGSSNVRGVASLNSMPIVLTTINPNVHSIKDLSNADRIGLPAVKVSIQAVTLQMAAAKQWGIKSYDKLDHLTVSMKHPDAMAAMLSKSNVDAHFGSPPYYQEELEKPGVHKILSSYDVLGGKSTFNTIWATQGYRQKNPKVYAAVFAALQQAMAFIKAHPRQAAQIYIEQASSKLPESLIYKIITDPAIEFTVTPKNVMKYAQFMHKTGSIDHMPKSWKDVFFDNLSQDKGS
ncbi:ABC transporter substrate-binding protein [Salinisphaera hydrothermalis]|uniref:ABC transporter substrate-binding protein n=1 Tax=Salinisphaera hydrothermalis (strain C41B8) TaxID=1304275 RepID=A0A084IPP2_SALHC|nr:ABC transporter substrate-binding protein [Salinisphaera hydrothermalis]KEZ78676.1 ABC transporter substrate-binding protein [Salinisphaera hydrothermalis C41B8]